ncbi:hypothetical protein C8R47DRAFT_186 [Mycena vitilis]|nr:hypothetical protein C8R47DRAFT_186 [Mycena vitilis]
MIHARSALDPDLATANGAVLTDQHWIYTRTYKTRALSPLFRPRRGASLSDILNVSRTSSYFRRISFTNRQLWIDASDSYRISLPLGETLKTTDVSLLPRCTARGVSIQYKFRQHHDLAKPVAPIRTYESTRLYDLPSWAFWSPSKYSQRSFIGHTPPTVMNVLPGGRALLFGSLDRLGIYDLHGEYGYELEVPCCTRFDARPGEAAATIDWDSIDNGAHIGLAIISKAYSFRHDIESYLSVFRVDYSRSARSPSVRRTHVFTLPIDAAAVSIKGPLILVRSSSEIILLDLQSSQRGWWTLQEGEITLAAIDTFHQSISLVVDSRSDNSRSLQTIPIPASMEAFGNTSSPFWTPYRFAPRTIHALPAPKFSFAYGYPTIKSLIADEGGTTFREAILAVDARTAVISSTRIRTGPEPAAQFIESSARTHKVAQPLALFRSSHDALLGAVGSGVLAVLRAEDAKFLTLEFPAKLMPGVGRTVAFDDVFGIGVAFARGRLFVMQY